MTQSRGFIWKAAALAVICVGAAFILGTAPRSAETASAPFAEPTAAVVQPTHTQNPVVAVQPTAVPPTPLPTDIPATATPQSQPAMAQPVAFNLQQQPFEQPTIIPPPLVKPVPNQITIRFAPGTTPDQQEAYVEQFGGTVQQTIGALNTLVVTLPDGAAQNLPRSPLVVQSEPDFYVSAQQTTPNDPYYVDQWALPVMQVPEAWPLLPPDAPTVAVAVIDSGICAGHPDLAGKILSGYDFVQNDATPQDEYGHGCSVSGIIAANTDNNLGVAGIAPNARIMPLRVLDASGNGVYSNVAAAIVYAADHGAQIINLSLGGSVPSTTLQDAVDYAVGHGAMVIAAAGNTYGDPVLYPAAYPNVIAVASVDSNLQPSDFNAVGPEIDVFAPGRNILTTLMDGSYTSNLGTSFATPQVAGIAALEIGRGQSLILDGGIIHADIPAPEPVLDKNGNPIAQGLESASIATDTWAVVLQPGNNPDTLAAQLGYENLGQIGGLPDTYLFRAPNTASSLQAAQETVSALQSEPKIVRFERQYAQQQFPRDPDDEPKFADQWHLNNTGQNGATAGEDANVVAAWTAGYTGTGSQIAIVDDGLQYTHGDLQTNYNASGSYDFNYRDPDPMPGNGDPHGTSAGGVAAAGDNGECGVGVAYNAQLAGIRLIAGASTDAMEASALAYQNGSTPGAATINDIYSNSWGPNDDGIVLGKPGSLTFAAMLNSVTYGRGGRGSIYVWAAGNGLLNNDNVNADGYANSRFVIAVGAVGADGNQAYYSEPGAPMLVTAPSSDTGLPGISTTDLLGSQGYNAELHSGSVPDYGDTQNCTNQFGGTSSATPLVSGVVALMLQANPDLTWRDVQYILLQTAEQNDPTDADWDTNGAGYHINHKYGFGRVDAGAAITAATTWQHVGPEGSETSAVKVVGAALPDYDPPSGGGIGMTLVPSTININTTQPVEHVEVILNVNHPYRGDLEVFLTSPQGTVSQLMASRAADGGVNYTNWKFSTVRDWGENPQGTWTLEVGDGLPGDTGTWVNWQLIVYTQEKPPVPSPQSPGNQQFINSIFGTTPVTLNWTTTAPFNTNGYELLLDTVTPPVASFNVPTTSYAASLPAGTYFWQVRAIGNSTVGNSNFSAIRSFTIGVAPNASPARNYFTTAAPVLTWAHLSWATAYQIEISTTATFAAGTRVLLTPDGTGVDPAIPASAHTFVVAPPLGEGVYYWRVRGRKADGTTWSTTWSVYDSFIVDL
ncbi:MAG: S8 family serine peptidase [Anaerolineae bacterium]|nr:S8 family serine peptidase [Anaerolineae bacterium]